MKKRIFIGAVLIILSFFAAQWTGAASNACIYGTAVNSDGSKIDGTARISTSWNGETAYPRNGEYRLCLGSNPGKRITVYVDGKTYAEIYVDGDTRLNIVRR